MTGKQRLARATAIAAVAAAMAWAFGQWSGAIQLVLVVTSAMACVALAAPWLGVRALDDAIGAIRRLIWRSEQGHHHAIGGISLHIEDDGRHVWIAAQDLQRVLGSHDRDDVLAARHTGRWRRDAQSGLWLRVDAVVDRLSHGPGRLDPHTAKIRRYFEREVLFPASERKRRRQG
jgi:hypothetical protein